MLHTERSMRKCVQAMFCLLTCGRKVLSLSQCGLSIFAHGGCYSKVPFILSLCRLSFILRTAQHDSQKIKR